MENAIPAIQNAFRKRGKALMFGILAGILSCLVCSLVYAVIAVWGYFEFNCGQQMSLASADLSTRNSTMLIPDFLIRQLQMIAVQIFFVRNFSIYILVGVLTGLSWDFLRAKNAPIFLKFSVVGIFIFVSFELFRTSFPALRGIMGITF